MALITSMVIVVIIHFGLLSRLDNVIYDQLAALDRPVASPDVAIIAIDEQSLAQLGKWPWARDQHKALFDELQDHGAAVTAFDILLSEPGDASQDEALAIAMAPIDHLLIPVHFNAPGRDGAPFDISLPVPIFKEAADDMGHVNVLSDSDGTVRRISLCFDDPVNGKQWPHLMELVYRAFKGQVSADFKDGADCGETLILPYAVSGSFQTMSYSSIVNGEIPSAFLENKIVIIGATAAGLGDQYPVPLAEQGTMAGVEIMANMLTASLDDNYIRPAPFWLSIILSLSPLWVVLIGFWRWRPQTTIWAVLGMTGLVLAGCYILLINQIWLAPSAALVGLAFLYPIWGWRRLQATSDFMQKELVTFRSSKFEIPVAPPAAGPVDIVTGQAEELTHAISHMRDLRRFIADSLTNLPDPMFVTDMDDNVQFVNKLAKTQMDDAASPDIHLHAMLDQFVDSADRTMVQDYIEASQDSQTLDYIDFQSADGRIFAMRRAPVLTDNGDLQGHIHYLADITEVANAAQQREEVLQLLSHDMRSPQAAILALLETRKNIAEADQQSMDQRIAGFARRTLALADNFVSLARMQSSEFLGEDVLLSELVQEAVDGLWPIAMTRDVKLIVENKFEDAFVSGEPAILYRALVNLIDNAIKFSPEAAHVSVTLRRIDLDQVQHISVTVEDEGEGIAPELLPHLFDRFVSDDRGASGSLKGSGIGLNFVQQVITRHGGQITAENLRSGGACFTILLPTAPDEPEEKG